MWDNGEIKSYYLHGGKIYSDEYMYIHFWCRPMSYRVKDFSGNRRILIYSDVATDRDFEINEELIKKLGKGNPIAFYAKSLWINRKN